MWAVGFVHQNCVVEATNIRPNETVLLSINMTSPKGNRSTGDP